MPITTVTLVNTFDEWRIKTNETITALNNYLDDGVRDASYTYRNITVNVANANTVNTITISSNTIYANTSRLLNLNSTLINVGNIFANSINTINLTMLGNIVLSRANVTFVTPAVSFGNSGLYWSNSPTVGVESAIFANGSNTLIFVTANQERMRLDQNGLLNIAGLPVVQTITSAFDRANVANTLPVQKAGVLTSTRNKVNFIEGSAITISISDNSVDDRADITISSSAAGTVDVAAAFGQANTGRTHANGSFLTANAAFDRANLANGTANTALIVGSAAFDRANVANTTANTTYSSAVLKTGNTMTGNLVMSGANITFITSTVAFPNSGIYWSNTPTVGIESAIYSNGSNTIVLATAKQERLRVDPSGNVGINTASPLAKLHVFGDVSLNRNALGSVSGSTTIDIKTANYFTATSTGTITWTFSNPTSSGNTSSFILELTNGGSYTQNWPAAVKWPQGSAPSLTASGVDILAFMTIDGGTTYRGILSIRDSK